MTKLLNERIAMTGLMRNAYAACLSLRTAVKWLRSTATTAAFSPNLTCRICKCLMASYLSRAASTWRSAACTSAPRKTRPRRATHSNRITGDRRGLVEGAGWAFAPVAIDDYSRIGFVQIDVDERGHAALVCLQIAIAQHAPLGERVERLLTDNGSACRSRLFAKTCQALGIKHSSTRPYQPQSNGKPECFIQTCLLEWTCVRRHDNSAERTASLPADVTSTTHDGLIQRST